MLSPPMLFVDLRRAWNENEIGKLEIEQRGSHCEREWVIQREGYLQIMRS